MRKIILSFAVLFTTLTLSAHPMPNSVVSLSVLQHSIQGEAKMPLVELETALNMKIDTSLNVCNAFFRNYFLQHIKATSGNDTWTTTVEDIHATDDVDNNIGNYQEVIVHFTLMPQNVKDLRQFVFDYNAIIHQVVTHKILVFLKDDWKNGIHEESMGQPIGIIETNFKEGEFIPLTVNLEEGSWWKGFESMVNLGINILRKAQTICYF